MIGGIKMFSLDSFLSKSVVAHYNVFIGNEAGKTNYYGTRLFLLVI
jgi:hypothetical protein